MANTVVILGGAYAGVQIAHRLLKATKPTVKDLKVILVSKNSHFYWNLAAVRAIVPGILKDDEFLKPIAPAFAKYSADDFEFIVGSAEALDPEAKTVKVSTASGEKSLSYDQLVIATGTRAAAPDMPWKAAGSYEEIIDILHSVQDKVKAASHIVVAGAGATGVEVSGELRFEYKDKEVLLLSADPKIVGGDSIAPNVEGELKKLGVTIKTDAKVANTTTLPDGKIEVTLANGEKITTDLYLPTMGLVPNTEFVPASLLTDRKFVSIDENFAVKGAKDIWAVGDVVWTPRGSFVNTDKQAAGVAKNVDAAFKTKKFTPVKNMPMDIFVMSTGRERGAGRLGPVKIFSIMAYYAKVKDLGISRLPPWLDGSMF